MHNSNPSSDAGSVKSGSPSHSYKKSLSSKANPNTALVEDQNSMLSCISLIYTPVMLTNQCPKLALRLHTPSAPCNTQTVKVVSSVRYLE